MAGLPLRLVGALSLLFSLGCSEAESNPCGDGAYADDRDGTCFCEPGFTGDPAIGCVEHDDVCAEAEERVGHQVCAHSIVDEAQWTEFTVGGGPPIGGIRRLGKYMVPAIHEARLPTVFADANSYRLHYCLMSAGFAPLFPGITTADHAELILTKAGREYYAGAVYELQTPDEVRFAFSVETASRPEEMLSIDTIYGVYRQLADRFELGDLGYLPRGTMQQEGAAAWVDAPFAVVDDRDNEITYEAYTRGIAYGRVRTVADGDPADFSWQDIVVFDEVPVNWEGVMAAAVTGQRQDILSHLNVLSAQRGTPNFFVDDAVAVFDQFEGELVRVDASANSYKLRIATQDEAEAFWDETRPSVAVENPAEFDYAELDGFAAIPTDTAAQRAQARSRFGAKTVGLATLAPLIDPELQTPGLGVPFRYYDAFMTANTWQTGGQTLSYADTIAAWLADDEFRTNASLRRERLASLRDEMRTNGVVSSELVEALRDRIIAEFGSDTVMVRVRSSSNAEDTPTFNGAGLYDSTSACAADSFAAGSPTASLCDPNKGVRTLERGLAKVWASLWNYGAFEERDYFQMDHRRVAMGATISMRFEDELANGVAFTGNPVDGDQPVYTINVQAGETDVVSPTPGVTAELSFLTMAEGRVVTIDRVVESSLVPSGQTVMSDDRLTELGELMAAITEVYPVDYETQGSDPPILDLEFKITSDGRLIIKQIRTFLATSIVGDGSCRE